MTRHRRPADAARRRAQRSARRSSTRCPTRTTSALVAFGSPRRSSRCRRRPTARSSRRRSRRCTPGEGTALGDAIVLAARRSAQRAEGEGRRRCRRRSVLAASPTARADGGQTAPLDGGEAGEGRRRHRLDGRSSARRTASSRRRSPAATRSRSACRRAPARCRRIAQDDGRRVLPRAHERSAQPGLRASRDARRPRTADREITDLFAGGAIVLLLVGGGALGALVPEGPVKTSPSSCSRPSRVAPRSPSAPRRRPRRTSARACRSACRVAGPWVRRRRTGQAPSSSSTCPKSFIVGGLDAELSEPRDRRRLRRAVSAAR